MPEDAVHRARDELAALVVGRKGTKQALQSAISMPMLLEHACDGARKLVAKVLRYHAAQRRIPPGDGKSSQAWLLSSERASP